MPNSVKPKRRRIAVIGLGYVGLPLAVEFGKHYATVGFDISAARVAELKRGRDSTLEVPKEALRAAQRLDYTTQPAALKRCDFYVVTVPTPIDKYKQPDLTPLIAASQTVGRVLSKGDVVVYESTVYPGCTEEVCVPVLEQVSGLRFNRDFFAGYSPERINPGDRQHRLTTIRKITSGSTPEAAALVDEAYASIITAGTHKVSSIRVAEAAKVIENTQRDVNIALVNELALIFRRLGLDTEEVLQAAGTKWNFLPFRPGLVGGHCIGVDPYYLTHKAQEIGYHPDMILAGRRINDNMGLYVAAEVIKLLTEKRLPVKGARVLVMGLTFKENCPDVRNSKVADVIRELERYGARVDVYDPWVKAQTARREYGVTLVAAPRARAYEAIVLAVPHQAFRELGVRRIRRFGKTKHVIYDVKYLFAREATDGRL
jgi:UDP-N-acetyl-D-galactosamine dehydrogenase